MKRAVLSKMTAALIGAALLVGACGEKAKDEATPAQPDQTLTDATTTAAAKEPPSTTTSDSVAVSWPHDWTEERVGGGRFDAGDYEGQDLVLWFWAPW